MLHLIYDTETTGLPKDYKAHVHDVDNWPRLVQLAWLVMDDEYQTLTSRNHIIIPEGFEIPAAAEDIHGINTEMAMKEGTEIHTVLAELAVMQEVCDVQAGHNINFDRKVLGAEFIRADMEHAYNRAKDMLPRICTMFKSTKHCGLRNSRGGIKWPTLQELHFFLFLEEFENSHDAMADVLATQKCYIELMNRGIVCP